MTTNFTLRDFFVFLLTGIILLFCIGTIFYQEIVDYLAFFFHKYPFIEKISFILTLFITPVIYLLGHLIGTISYAGLILHKMPCLKRKCLLLKFFDFLLYGQRSVYAIKEKIEEMKKNQENIFFKTVDEFWTYCALLQQNKCYNSAEYWNLLNEFFNSINIIFSISAIIAFIFQHWILGIIYFVLSVLSFFRAKQHATNFVNTVVRQIKCLNQDNLHVFVPEKV